MFSFKYIEYLNSMKHKLKCVKLTNGGNKSMLWYTCIWMSRQ